MTAREERIQKFRLLQGEDELRRKAEKARCRSSMWTQEELDLIDVEAKSLSDWFAMEGGFDRR